MRATSSKEIYFLGFRAPAPPLPLMPNVGQPRFSQKSAPIKWGRINYLGKYWGCDYWLIAWIAQPTRANAMCNKQAKKFIIDRCA